VKTLRAFLWGSALGAIVGLILAPDREALARAQLEHERGETPEAAGAPEAATRPTVATGTQTPGTTP
jgi:hypothetical protein